MNGEYIYDVFATTEKNDISDLMVGLSMLQVDKPLPDGLTEREIDQFIGAHYNELVKAYKSHDIEIFAKVVSDLEAE